MIATRTITVRMRDSLAEEMAGCLLDSHFYATMPEMIANFVKNAYMDDRSTLDCCCSEDELYDVVDQQIDSINRGVYIFKTYKGEWFQTVIRLPAELYGALVEYTEILDITVTDYIRYAIIRGLRKTQQFNSNHKSSLFRLFKRKKR